MNVDERFLELITREAGARPDQVLQTVRLFDEGATIPFIARYRKDVTGNLDERQIALIYDRNRYFNELIERRSSILNTIREQEKLTTELESQIMECSDKTTLEDLYLPFKPKRRTKATVARERGLQQLADIMASQPESGEDPLVVAERYLDTEKGVGTGEDALIGAGHIIAETISEDAEVRGRLRALLVKKGKIVSTKTVESSTKFDMYHEFSEAVATIPSHRMLAIRRGAAEGILTYRIQYDSDDIAVESIRRKYIAENPSQWRPHMEHTIKDSFDRLLQPSIENEVRSDLKIRSDEDAIRVFEDNLENLLLSPPAGPIRVLGIDPGFRTGCKVVVVDETGKFLEYATIFPTAPRSDTEGAAKKLSILMDTYTVNAICIGNGTASRETDAFVRDFLSARDEDVFSIVVDESGASVYSASEIAREEHPDLDVTIRGALSIARRLQDPLAELVKIDPKSLGIGQYQHDVDQKLLKASLQRTVESCVNRVGVELNTASWSLLRYTSGLSERVAKNIVEYRNKNGMFSARSELLHVKGLGTKTYQLCAGFLRIRSGKNPLDNSGVHPESYEVVEQITGTTGVTIEELIGNQELIDGINFQVFRNEDKGIGDLTLQDIRTELLRPGRDPRSEFVAPSYRDDVREINDLEIGMRLQGRVTNVTRFGAFVDIGVHQDGLVHVSELDHRYTKDPTTVIKVGDIIDVEVISVEIERKRIGLSRKRCTEPPQRPKRHRRKKQRRLQKSLDDQIKKLIEHFEDPHKKTR